MNAELDLASVSDEPSSDALPSLSFAGLSLVVGILCSDAMALLPWSSVRATLSANLIARFGMTACIDDAEGEVKISRSFLGVDISSGLLDVRARTENLGNAKGADETVPDNKPIARIRS